MKKFSNSFNGYNKDEVNSFVATVAKEYESMLNKLKAQDLEIEKLNSNLEKYQNLEDTLNKTILVAEDASTQIKRMARDESKGIIDEAKKNASRIINDALVKAQKYETDAEELRKRVVSFKKKYKQAMESEIEAIEEIAEDY
ncbi:MAG: DivIVA domain-containing protein [Bacilli bacterium]|nr:DivIVA domain-containing protein [Bacilli bacterium]